MPKPHFCKYCHFYQKEVFTRAGYEKFGICNNVIASSQMVQDTTTIYSENSVVYTEQYFGCVHWRDNPGVLIDVSAIVKDQLKDEGYDVK